MPKARPLPDPAEAQPPVGGLEALAGAPGPELGGALQQAFWARARQAGPGAAVAWLDSPTLLDWRAKPEAWPSPLAGAVLATPVGWMQEQLRLHGPWLCEGLRGLNLPVPPHDGLVFMPVALAQHAMTEALAPLVGPGRPLGPMDATEGGQEVGLFASMPHLEPAFLRVQLLDALGRGIEGGRGLAEGPDEAPPEGTSPEAWAAAWKALGLAEAWARSELGSANEVEARAQAAAMAPWPEGVKRLAARVAADVAPGLLGMAGFPEGDRSLGLWPPLAPPKGYGRLLRVGWVAIALAAYLNRCLRGGLLDQALTMAVYLDALAPHPDYARTLGRLHAAACERLDERPYRWQAFLQARVASGLQLVVSLACDPGQPEAFFGGLREPLGADPQAAWAWARQAQALRWLPPQLGPFTEVGRAVAIALRAEARGEDSPAPGPIPLAKGVEARLNLDHPGPVAMLDAVARRLVGLVRAEGVKPKEIVVVCPRVSPLVVWALRRRLGAAEVPLYLAAGTNRIHQHRAARALLTMAAWAGGPAPKGRHLPAELLELATGVPGPILHPHLEALLEAMDRAVAKQAAAPPDGSTPLPFQEGLPEDLLEAFPSLPTHLGLLAGFLGRPSAGPNQLSARLREAFGALMLGRAADPRFGSEEGQREASLAGQIIDLASGFEAVDARLQAEEGAGERALRWAQFLGDNPVMARPFFQREPHDGAILLASPAKLAELGFAPGVAPAKHVVWLDAASSAWRKRERRELGNARVLAQGWDGRPYGRAEEEVDELEKLARTVWALAHLVGGTLWVDASPVDELGQDQDGTLARLLATSLGLAVPA